MAKKRRNRKLAFFERLKKLEEDFQTANAKAPEAAPIEEAAVKEVAVKEVVVEDVAKTKTKKKTTSGKE
jgi:hypothetical protein